MSDSILNSTKRALDLDPAYTPFDQNIILHINSVFSTLNQLGIGPVDGFEIEDDTTTWDDFLANNTKFNFVKTYMYLRVKLLFDPPGTSYLVTAMKEQIDELTWRMSTLRENSLWMPTLVTVNPELDGGNAVGG